MHKMSKIWSSICHLQKLEKMRHMCTKSWNTTTYMQYLQVEKCLFAHLTKMCQLQWIAYFKVKQVRNFYDSKNQESINCHWRRIVMTKQQTTSMQSNSNLNLNSNSTNAKKLKFLQHNCVKFTNVMYACLKYAKKESIDILLLQESWTRDNKTISHFNFICIISQIADEKFRVCVYISRTNKQFKCTSRIDLINDADCQILNISINIIKDLKMINVYNEKSKDKIYTCDQILSDLKINSNLIICDNFNAHHSWWNSNIVNFIRTNNLLKWINKHQCNLINISNKYTFIWNSKHFSKTVIDLTFANLNIENLIINWCVDSESTESDHETIRFDLLTDMRSNLSNQEAIEISHHYNVDKADWEKFDQYLQNQKQSFKLI